MYSICAKGEDTSRETCHLSVKLDVLIHMVLTGGRYEKTLFNLLNGYRILTRAMLIKSYQKESTLAHVHFDLK